MNSSPPIPVDAPDAFGVIGRSEERRGLIVTFVGSDRGPLRVLLIAGQHGDERRSVRVARRVAETFGKRLARNVSLAIISELNPDGVARRSRHNARGVDLNRDHQRLRSAEVRALHAFVRAWRPHLAIDLHTYPPRRRRLLAEGLIHCHDVLIEGPTNPNLGRALAGLSVGRAVREITTEINRHGFRTARYVLTTAAGNLRHGTPDVEDARNGLGIRYGIPVFLVEGRQSAGGEGKAVRARSFAAMRSAVAAIIRWTDQHGNALTSPPAAAEPRRVAVGARYRRTTGDGAMDFADPATGRIRSVKLAARLKRRVRGRRRITPPAAYAVPVSAGAVIDLLRRHGLEPEPAREVRPQPVERLRVRAIKPSARPGLSPRKVWVDVVPAVMDLHDHVLYPVCPQNARALAVFLEPASKYGFWRHNELDLSRAAGEFSPILRIPADAASPARPIDPGGSDVAYER